MNALFIQRMSDYIHSPLRLASAAVIIATKISHSNHLLTHFHQKPYPSTLQAFVPKSAADLLLYEGRVARYYLATLPNNSTKLGYVHKEASPS